MFKNITLEISLKPFKETTDEYIQSVCRKVYEQWKPLVKNRETVSIMMWSSDGSELLDYTGDPDKEFEWARYVGTANKPLIGDMPAETSPHIRKQLYMKNPPVMTYRILKTIVDAFKREGKRLFPDSVIRVGTTFDIGPEFAVSDFKYNRHKEVCSGTGCGDFGFVDATALLKGDTRPYAAYPCGIPDKTPMGAFLGAQANAFMKDMGFDYIWLSNGMGFCYEPWNSFGKIYDGEKFYAERLPETREKVLLFWKLFRDNCPDYPVETRGTNFSVGIDYASDGVPLYDIYKGGFNITPPPNSPWAAINDDVGIEVLGQLTRNCISPEKDYMFRFYLHDVWWMNSPWYDRYESSPYDIYIPMALSRIDESGDICTPSLFNILSVDNSKGDMPESCVNEVIPHILKAEKDAPDEPSPLVLVYPFREYTTAIDEENLREMYFCDTFLQNAINCGFPLATVVSADNFAKHSFDTYRKSVLVVPAAVYNKAAEERLAEFAQAGGKIIAFGSRDALDKVKYPAKKVEIYGETEKLFEALSEFGYSIQFVKETRSPLPVMTVHRSNNAMLFSVYNRDTTVETGLKFPLGAPVLNGFSTKLTDGCASYHFNKSVHAECRVFVKQKSGVVKAKEEPPVNMKYRRRIRISGLSDASVCLFGESYCKDSCIVTNIEPDGTPVPLDGWKVVTDAENGTYLYAENVSGEISVCMPNK
ncbi:MAG: hypothetical protein E7441_06735 [Ruminococcaceae bacterium]|nr:hypothetical protein [Oscillospiraceae bacterium]